MLIFKYALIQNSSLFGNCEICQKNHKINRYTNTNNQLHLLVNRSQKSAKNMILFKNSQYVKGAYFNQVITLQTQKTMDIQHSVQHLTSQLLNLSLSQSLHTAPKRISNTLVALQMQSQQNPGHIDQYNILYLNRLKILGSRIPLQKVIKIQEVEQQLGTVSIIGIFKRIEAKRVRAFQKKFDQYYGNLENIYQENDTLQLQDSSGKLKFVLKPNATMNGMPIKCTDLPYGIIIGLTGKNNDDKMQFMVDRITLPALPPQKPVHSINTNVNKNTNNYNHNKQNRRKALFMSLPTVAFLQFVLNLVCQERFEVYEDVQSVVVMGFRDRVSSAEYRKLDEIFDTYGDSIDIHIMPNDRLGQIYPQKPLHPILLSKSYKKISLINNPQIFNPSIPQSLPSPSPSPSTTQILVSCGQNIKDLKKNSSLHTSSIQCAKQLIMYNHIAPTCPFSMKCQMMEQDYLIIKEVPHVFIVGDCEHNVVDLWEKDGRKCMIVGVKAGAAMILDIDLLEIQDLDVYGAGAYR